MFHSFTIGDRDGKNYELETIILALHCIGQEIVRLNAVEKK